MDSLLKLSDIASKAERLTDTSSSTSSGSLTDNVPSCQASSSSSTYTETNVPSCSVAASSSRVAISDADRVAIRDKIKCAFRKKADNFEQLLDLSSAVAEDHAYECALSKLDYYKTGISSCKRIFDVSNTEASKSLADLKDGSEVVATDDSAAQRPTVKRAKTQH